MDKNKNFLDGSPEEQLKATKDFFSSFTEEEIKMSMSDELSYLDEE